MTVTSMQPPLRRTSSILSGQHDRSLAQCHGVGQIGSGTGISGSTGAGTQGSTRQIGIVVAGLETSVFGVLRDIRSVLAAANLSDGEKVTATQSLLDQGKTDDFDQLKDDLAATASEASWHDILEARSVKLQNRFSPLLRALTFMQSKRAAALLEAIDHFKNSGDLSTNSAPMGFLDSPQ